MRQAEMLWRFGTAWALGLSIVSTRTCSAEQRPSLEDTFKAVILRAAPATTSTTAIGKSAHRDAAAQELAADLVRSLSSAVAGAAALEGEGAAREWNSMWEKVAGVSLEVGHRGPVAEERASEERERKGMLRGEGAAPVEGFIDTEASAAPAASRGKASYFSPAQDARRLFEEGGGVGRGGTDFAECEEVAAGPEDFLKIESTWLNLVMTVVCVTCAGLAAGLTMGLLSIEPLEMAIKQRSGTVEEKRQASRILPLVSRHHFLLVTLLLFNSLANEALPIFLGNLVPSWLAVILSVTLVLFFGEIFPSAVFTGKNQLAIAAAMSWFVYALMMVLGAVAWPIAWMLDRVLGIEGFKRYNRAEIAALVEVQHELSHEDNDSPSLHVDEVSIVNGVLLTAQRSVAEAMITMDKVFCLEIEEKLTGNTMADIMAAGYSRVLVYEGNDTRNIRGYLQVKKLIVLNPDDERVISSLMLRIPVVVSPTKSLLELLNTFQTGRSHLALVSASPAITLESLKRGVPLEGAARPLGIITLEDIIEEIIQEEILDESDRLSQFIEDRAKDTLSRFARMRRERQGIGQLNPRLASVLGSRTTPRRNKDERGSIIRHRGASGAPPSPSYQYQSMEGGGNSFSSSRPHSPEPAAAPGIDERASLLASSSRAGSKRRTSILQNSKRTSTLGQAMIAAASRSREHSTSSEVGAAGPATAQPPYALPAVAASDGSSVNSTAEGTSTEEAAAAFAPLGTGMAAPSSGAATNGGSADK